MSRPRERIRELLEEHHAGLHEALPEGHLERLFEDLLRDERYEERARKSVV